MGFGCIIACKILCEILFKSIYMSLINCNPIKLNVYDLDNGLLKCAKTHFFDRLHSGFCSISGAYLPKWVLSLETAKQHISQYKKYHGMSQYDEIMIYDYNSLKVETNSDIPLWWIPEV